MKSLKLPTLPKLAARERLFAFLGALMVVLTVMDRLILTPWWRHARQVHQDIHDLEQQVATNRRLLSRSNEVAAKIQVYHDYLRSARPPEVEMGELVREVQSSASESGVTGATVTPLPTTENWPYQEHALDVQYTGNLEQSVRFVYLLESSKKLFRVQHASLSLEKRASDQLQGSLRLTSVAILGAKAMPVAGESAQHVQR